ncbi:hypothetical protein K490DRAFT_58116 [Saccharata proteae CBS 121410]|uniref:Uncharacterized protein n=1 Tax=Saccharata proteae CBS 121410 TaxID=1314787 RepID=A0A9P4LVN5_9PEZI|nr:hypothetical protein K490DRAFT_58116 [Saccharata proteae CBS 121410]
MPSSPSCSLSVSVALHPCSSGSSEREAGSGKEEGQETKTRAGHGIHETACYLTTMMEETRLRRGDSGADDARRTLGAFCAFSSLSIGPATHVGSWKLLSRPPGLVP